MRIGVLTGGGDCPGLNPVIRAIVRAALPFGDEIVGIRNGWAHNEQFASNDAIRALDEQIDRAAKAMNDLFEGMRGTMDEAAAKKWVDSEFQPSTLSKDQQMAEMKWFIEAAKKLQAKGVKEISVVSETITTHEYESKTLAKAFSEITGITVKHDLIQEGDVVEKLQTSMQSGKSIYDGWISDSDLIGTHYRYGKIMNLTDYMAGKGKEWTNPGLDLKDFIGTSFTTGPDKKLYQLPDQQFANLYW